MNLFKTIMESSNYKQLRLKKYKFLKNLTLVCSAVRLKALMSSIGVLFGSSVGCRWPGGVLKGKVGFSLFHWSFAGSSLFLHVMVFFHHFSVIS